DGRAFSGDDALEAGLARHVQQDRGKALIVLDDENNGVAAVDRIAIVDQRFLLGLLGNGAHLRRSAGGVLHRGRNVVQRQIQRERAALARRADDAEFAAQEPRDFTADREAKTRTAILATGRSIGLV